MFTAPKIRRVSSVIAALAVVAVGLAIAPDRPALAANTFGAGNLVVVRVGAGTHTLSDAAQPVFLDEYTRMGALVRTRPLPTVGVAGAAALTLSGTGSDEGALTRSPDGRFLALGGYDAAPGTAGVTNTAASTVNRTVAVVDAVGAVDTSTRLSAYSQGSIRGATTTDGTDVWTAGGGGRTDGGVLYTQKGATVYVTTAPGSHDTRVPQVVDGRLYVSADQPGLSGVNVLGAGLPKSGGQSIRNTAAVSGGTSAFAFVDRVPGVPGVDTLYTADPRQGLAKFALVNGAWVAEGGVAGSYLGLTATGGPNPMLYASTGDKLVLLIDDAPSDAPISVSPPVTLAMAAPNTALRGVALAPTSLVTGPAVTPPLPAPGPHPPTITAPAPLTGSIGDPTNPTATVTIGDAVTPATAMTVIPVATSNPAVAPLTSVHVSGVDQTRTIAVTPVGVGFAQITLQVSTGAYAATTVLTYAASAAAPPTARYPVGAANTSTAVDVGDGFALLAEDTGQALRLFDTNHSGSAVASFDFTDSLNLTEGDGTVAIEASARQGDTIYWLGSLTNGATGAAQADHNRIFATRVHGHGAGTTLTFAGSYGHLRQDLLTWDHAHGDRYGLAASTAVGRSPQAADGSGLSLEGLEFAADGHTAYLAFRAPIAPAYRRTKALVVPVTNFRRLFSGAAAECGAAIEWDLAGRGVRELRRNTSGQYLIVAGPASGTGSQALYTWTGNPGDPAVEHLADLAATGNTSPYEAVVTVPSPLTPTTELHLIADSGDADWYANGGSAATLPGLQKSRIDIVALGAPVDGAPETSVSAGPDRFSRSRTATLRFQRSSGDTAQFTCRLDAGDPVLCAAPNVYPNLSDGPHRFTVYATDRAGRTDVTPAVVNWLVDATAPRVSLAPSTVEAVNRSGATVTFAASAVDGVDGSLTATCTHSSGSRFPIGATPVTCTATDRAGNVGTAQATMTVRDSTAPQLLGVPAGQTVEATGAGGATASWTDPHAVDSVDGAVQVYCDRNAGSVFPLGSTQVDCLTMDRRGNVARASFAVTVRDSRPPALSGLPDNRVVPLAGPAGTPVSWTPPTVTDTVDNQLVPACSPASGAVFPRGVTSVSCVATDRHGNATAATFTVTVGAGGPPLLSGVPTGLVAEAGSARGAVVSWPAPTAQDVHDGRVAALCLPASGTLFAPGSTVVSCTATNRAGDRAASSFVVTVRDTTVPVLYGVPLDRWPPASSAQGAPVNWPMPTSADLLDPQPRVVCSAPPGAVLPIGRTSVLCTATDAHGNAASAAFAVTVRPAP